MAGGERDLGRKGASRSRCPPPPDPGPLCRTESLQQVSSNPQVGASPRASVSEGPFHDMDISRSCSER